ncbi:iron-sulfur cluster assembly scaffold protein [Vibrio chagasii]|nr:iron-sulfur cluster assembly scaffold protein [Vibrio chagasii]
MRYRTTLPSKTLKSQKSLESRHPVKVHCSTLAEDAIKAAVADYKKKR